MKLLVIFTYELWSEWVWISNFLLSFKKNQTLKLRKWVERSIRGQSGKRKVTEILWVITIVSGKILTVHFGSFRLFLGPENKKFPDINLPHFLFIWKRASKNPSKRNSSDFHSSEFVKNREIAGNGKDRFSTFSFFFENTSKESKSVKFGLEGFFEVA